jgi:hypothetical protein
MHRLQKSLALGFLLVCFPLGALAQTKGQYVPRPSQAAKDIFTQKYTVKCPRYQCRNHCQIRCWEDPTAPKGCACDPACIVGRKC